jgi:hypothetical protein
MKFCSQAKMEQATRQPKKTSKLLAIIQFASSFRLQKLMKRQYCFLLDKEEKQQVLATHDRI